jgi:hypothetical protein
MLSTPFLMKSKKDPSERGRMESSEEEDVPKMLSKEPSTPPTGEPEVNDALRPFRFHGLDLAERGGHAVADCPFCGRDGKFSVEVATGLWRCFVCNAGADSGQAIKGGNPLTFIRLLWDRSDASTNGEGDLLAGDRGYLDRASLTAWGICRSISTRDWLVPGYSADGRLDQLYRRIKMKDKDGRWSWKLLPTSGLWPEGKVHAIHGAFPMNREAEWVYLCEGPWDGVALWEMLGQARRGEGNGLEFIGNPASSLLASSNVLAVPGCLTFRDDWLPLFSGKHVVLCYDSDHPREHPPGSGNKTMAGHDAMRRVAGILAAAVKPPASVRFIRWGSAGFDPTKKSGWDVRDELNQGATVAERVALLDGLVKRMVPIPDGWVTGEALRPKSHGHTIEPLRCSEWPKVEAAWMGAMRWRDDLRGMLLAMLSVVASTSQTGNQLFLQVIGDAGSGKSEMCDALLVSRRCHALEHLTGFHSGWKGENGEDCSLISRINHKTLITPEGDVLMSSPLFDEIMSQQRRIFDGKSGATFKNTNEDKRWTGLRTPWIIAGTPALLDMDQSRLGDRFMRYVIAPPSDKEKRAILMHVMESAERSVKQLSNGDDSSTVEGKMLLAYRLTGGYVDWLRDNAPRLLDEATCEPEHKMRCIELGEFTADMRARPNPDAKKLETHDSKELPTRIAHQYLRMAYCWTVAMGKTSVDDEVMRWVRKMAIDTSRGKSLDLVKTLAAKNPRNGKTYQQDGLTSSVLSSWLGMGEERMLGYLKFLRNVKVVQNVKVPGSKDLWKLTERVVELYDTINS